MFGEHKGPPLGPHARRNLSFESGAEREVALRFRGASARLARERWGERAREASDGEVVVATKVTPGNYPFGVVLGHGGDATVEGPADVVERFRERAAALAKPYAEQPGVPGPGRPPAASGARYPPPPDSRTVAPCGSSSMPTPARGR